MKGRQLAGKKDLKGLSEKGWGVIKALEKCKIISLAGHLTIFIHFFKWLLWTRHSFLLSSAPITIRKMLYFWAEVKPQLVAKSEASAATGRRWNYVHIYASLCSIPSSHLASHKTNVLRTQLKREQRFFRLPTFLLTQPTGRSANFCCAFEASLQWSWGNTFNWLEPPTKPKVICEFSDELF